MGFPIRTSPDHGMLASPRGFSQLATSFIAYLRQGIHTHALSSLTIKFTLDTDLSSHAVTWRHCHQALAIALANLWYIAHQYSIVKDLTCPESASRKPEASARLPQALASAFSRFPNHPQSLSNLVGLGRLELPTSPLSGVRSSHLSYRPGLCYPSWRLIAARGGRRELVELVGIEPATS